MSEEEKKEPKKIITPRGDRLLVKLMPETEINMGKLNLILPDQKDSYSMPHKGEVVAVGDGLNVARMAFAVGDIVFFSKYNEGKAGIKIEVDGIECVLLNTSDIYGRPKNSWREYVYTQDEVQGRLGGSGGDSGDNLHVEDGEATDRGERESETRTGLAVNGENQNGQA